MGLTQDEFASKLNMHGRQLARYEAGRCNPSIKVLKKIAKRSNINDLELLDLLRRIDRLKKPKREKLKWAIQGLLNTENKE